MKVKKPNAKEHLHYLIDKGCGDGLYPYEVDPLISFILDNLCSFNDGDEELLRIVNDVIGRKEEQRLKQLTVQGARDHYQTYHNM